ncbi:hypothetical protein AOLI_G00307610 [Acnodon oligacanthus]
MLQTSTPKQRRSGELENTGRLGSGKTLTPGLTADFKNLHRASEQLSELRRARALNPACSLRVAVARTAAATKPTGPLTSAGVPSPPLNRRKCGQGDSRRPTTQGRDQPSSSSSASSLRDGFTSAWAFPHRPRRTMAKQAAAVRRGQPAGREFKWRNVSMRVVFAERCEEPSLASRPQRRHRTWNFSDGNRSA